MSDWINAKDELPKDGQFVFVCGDYFKWFTTARYTKGDSFPWDISVTRMADKWSFDSVTHWMATEIKPTTIKTKR